MSTWDESFDFVIIGSGGGAMSAALLMKDRGKSAVIIEKLDKVGGSTSYSGGVLWMPNNPRLQPAGVSDSYEKARLYLDTLIGDVGPASSPQRRDAFLREGPEMIRFLEERGMQFVHAEWPDYYDARPGGEPRGRSPCSPLFNVKELGEWTPKLATTTAMPAIPLGSYEGPDLMRAKTNGAGKKLALRLAWRMIVDKLTGKRRRGSGNAMQGRMVQIVLRAGIPIWLETPARELIVESGRVTGVLAERNGRPIRIQARHGVLINAGGFSHNQAMRDQYQPQPSSTRWSASSPGDTGEMIQEAMRLGAAIDLMNESWWVPGSVTPQGAFQHFHVPADTGKPHCIVVDSSGKRFANEACAYMEFGQIMYQRGAVPAWAIIESRHRNNYPWGLAAPGITPAEWLRNGSMKKADTLEDLAKQCGIDADGLKQTVERFNGFARAGKDEDFQRGESAYNRYYADPSNQPNASLGTIEKPPYYAMAIYPTDVGTCGGIMTDEFARVLRADGSIIEGLYATGNCTASVMGRCYPGAGASIGASFTFGYIAARHALEEYAGKRFG